jgi:hypothetical protein
MATRPVRPAINPYIDMPLPVGTRIAFGFLPPPPADPSVRALNAYAYADP